jgi:hypothetical protein
MVFFHPNMLSTRQELSWVLLSPADLLHSSMFGMNLPTADPKSVGLTKSFETAMYKRRKEALSK